MKPFQEDNHLLVLCCVCCCTKICCEIKHHYYKRMLDNIYGKKLTTVKHIISGHKKQLKTEHIYLTK
jgi:hypothetical protein